MEAVTRRPFQGVINIIQFNWHLYIAATVLVIILFSASMLLNKLVFWICVPLYVGIVTSTFTSLVISYYIYDRSNLYDFSWLQQFRNSKNVNIVNVHAGFDETSAILVNRFPGSNLKVFDFYNPQRHTEISIERARRAYPAFPGTVNITTNELPVHANSMDFIFNIFALHEIRDRNERLQFLKQQAAGLKDGGSIIVVEHLRDLSNFLAYNIGFFHFLNLWEWNSNFQHAGLRIDSQFKVTSFVTVFILRKSDGNTP